MKRIRRGKEVEVPEQWVGTTTSKKTKRERKQRAEAKIAERRKFLKRDKQFDLNSQDT